MSTPIRNNLPSSTAQATSSHNNLQIQGDNKTEISKQDQDLSLTPKSTDPLPMKKNGDLEENPLFKSTNNAFPIEYITEAELNFEAQPSAQLITSRHKKKVKVSKNTVVKGPYSHDDQSFVKNTVFTKLLLDLEKDLGLDNDMKSALPIKRVLVVKDKDKKKKESVYLEFDNVGSFDKIRSSMTSSKLEKDVQVCDRGSFVNRISEMVNGCPKKIMKASLCHLFLRRALNVGDSGLHNILKINDITKFDGQLIAGIDLEETRLSNDKNKNSSFKKLVTELDKNPLFAANAKSDDPVEPPKQRTRKWDYLQEYMEWDLKFADIFSRKPSADVMKWENTFDEVKAMLLEKKKNLP